MKAHRGKFGASNVKLYVCKTQHDLNVCTNTLRRPSEEIESALLEEIQKRVLDEMFVTAVLREARVRLDQRIKQTETDDTPKLKTEIQKLKLQVANLAEAVANGGSSIPALVDNMKERQARLIALDGRLAALHAAPRALQLEVKRLEKDIVSALGELKKVFSEQPGDARRFLESLLDGKLTMTPIETWKGSRYKIEGKANLGGLIQLPQTLFVASPGRFDDQGVLELPISVVCGVKKTGVLATAHAD